MPVDINRLTEGWLELESDPGLFTLLLEDFGVKVNFCFNQVIIFFYKFFILFSRAFKWRKFMTYKNH